jgi:hypothetical protein
MNTLHVAESALPAYSHAFGRTLSIDELRNRTPAAFAGNASTRTKATYRFINTAGFSTHCSKRDLSPLRLNKPAAALAPIRRTRGT